MLSRVRGAASTSLRLASFARVVSHRDAAAVPAKASSSSVMNSVNVPRASLCSSSARLSGAGTRAPAKLSVPSVQCFSTTSAEGSTATTLEHVTYSYLPAAPAAPPSTPSMDLFSLLKDRGFVHQHSPPLPQHLSSVPRAIYAGFDPTADSLHLGNLLVILALAHCLRAGHKAVALVGTATGLVGDPSGRSSERSLLGADAVAANAAGIETVLTRMLGRATGTIHQAASAAEASGAGAVVVKNGDWFAKMSVVEYLRDVGKHFRLGQMLAKDSVKKRMEDADAASDSSSPAEGMSFTEFAYQTLQGFDFSHLNSHHGVTVQLGGSDQWGNITAGAEYHGRSVRARARDIAIAAGATEHEAEAAAAAAAASEGGEVYGLTLPLLTTSSGAKFGKSAGNALWLDPARTSPYTLLQYLLQTSDADCRRLLLLFTSLDASTVDRVCAAHAKAPEGRLAQKVLAMHVVMLVHGKEGVRQAAVATETLFPSASSGMWPPIPGETAPFAAAPSQGGLTSDELVRALEGVPTVTVPLSSLRSRARADEGDGHDGQGWEWVQLSDLAAAAGAVASKAAGRRLVQQGGLYVNHKQVKAAANAGAPRLDWAEHVLLDKIVLIRTGAKKFTVVVIEDDSAAAPAAE